MIGKVIGHIEETMEINKYQNKEVLKNTKNFGMGLKIKLITKMVVSANMVKVLQELNLTLMMIYP